MSSSLEITSEIRSLPYNFTQDVLREVRGLRVYLQIERLRRSVKNQECLEFLKLVKTVLAAQVTMKYAAKTFEEKAGYDRLIASFGRLIDQFGDDKRYNNEHRMYAYYALKKRCDELMGSYQKHIKNLSGDSVKLVQEENYSIKFMPTSQSSIDDSETSYVDDTTEIVVETINSNKGDGIIAKFVASARQFIGNNFDTPSFKLRTWKNNANHKKEESEDNGNKLCQDYLLNVTSIFSKTKELLFNNLIEERVPILAAVESVDSGASYLEVIDQVMDFESSGISNTRLESPTKSKASSKKKGAKRAKSSI